MKELEKKIVDYMNNWYKVEYTDYIEVTNENGIYSVALGIPTYLQPTYISLQTNDSNMFLDYVFKELRTRNYIRNYYYKIVKNETHRKRRETDFRSW